MSKRNREKRRPIWIQQGKVPSYLCAGCGKVMDGVTHIGEHQDKMPSRIGNISVCAYCAAYLFFLDERTTRLATEADLARIKPDMRRVLEMFRDNVSRQLAAQAQAQHITSAWLGRGRNL